MSVLSFEFKVFNLQFPISLYYLAQNIVCYNIDFHIVNKIVFELVLVVGWGWGGGGVTTPVR